MAKKEGSVSFPADIAKRIGSFLNEVNEAASRGRGQPSVARDQCLAHIDEINEILGITIPVKQTARQAALAAKAEGTDGGGEDSAEE